MKEFQQKSNLVLDQLLARTKNGKKRKDERQFRATCKSFFPEYAAKQSKSKQTSSLRSTMMANDSEQGAALPESVNEYNMMGKPSVFPGTPSLKLPPKAALPPMNTKKYTVATNRSDCSRPSLDKPNKIVSKYSSHHKKRHQILAKSSYFARVTNLELSEQKGKPSFSRSLRDTIMTYRSKDSSLDPKRCLFKRESKVLKTQPDLEADDERRVSMSPEISLM